MKKTMLAFYAILLVALSACGGGGGSNAEPTALSFPTAAPTNTPLPAIPTQEIGSGSPGEERTSPTDGMPQVYIPAGSFRMGGLDEDGTPDEEPARQVTISHGFWIDKVEVTNAMYTLCVQASYCNPPRSFASETRNSYFNGSEFANFPVINVTWDDAVAYCTWAGRRLPTEAEWEYAARGSDYRIYPWGDDRPDAQRANFNFLMRDTTPVGRYPQGASPFGILDMAGNVWEWVQDYYSQDFYAVDSNMDPTGPMAASEIGGERRVLRGGSWQDPQEELRVSNRGFALAPDHTADLGTQEAAGEANNKTGFRCVVTGQ